MIYEVTVERSFHARHRVAHTSGEWEPIHDHEWRVWATWRGAELDERGLLVDFAWAEEALRRVCSEFEGTLLNDHPLLGGRPAGAEVVAQRIFEGLERIPGGGPGRLWSVGVGEAPGCTAVYSRE
jgi:6-pyruvoyl-tetrahydropterin synthase